MSFGKIKPKLAHILSPPPSFFIPISVSPSSTTNFTHAFHRHLNLPLLKSFPSTRSTRNQQLLLRLPTGHSPRYCLLVLRFHLTDQMSSTAGDNKQAKADNDAANVDVAALVASYLPKYESAVKLQAKEAAENILQLKVAGLIDAAIAEATEDATITDAAMATNAYNTVKPRLESDLLALEQTLSARLVTAGEESVARAEKCN
jgi:hypothetical protein